MLNNLYILKDGLPIYINRNQSDSSSNSEKVDDDQITMMSGFFSAINSFAMTIGNFGSMKELKMNNVKFSFYKPENIKNDSLLFVGSSDTEISTKTMESLLSKISSEFLRKYPYTIENRWDGRTEPFNDFNNDVEKLIKEEKSTESIITDNELKSQNHVEYQNYNNIQEYRTNNYLISEQIRKENIRAYNDEGKRDQIQINYSGMTKFYNKELFYNMIPIKRGEHDNGIYEVFSGEDSRRIFKNIDGKRNIEQIGEITGLTKERVFQLCKTFIKMGLISLIK